MLQQQQQKQKQQQIKQQLKQQQQQKKKKKKKEYDKKQVTAIFNGEEIKVVAYVWRHSRSELTDSWSFEYFQKNLLNEYLTMCRKFAKDYNELIISSQ